MIFRGNLIVHSCPKSVKSIRFVKFCYWRALLPDGPHDRRLKEVPWQSEIWQKEYPHTAEYLSWDPETVQVVPHYSIISGNVIIDHKPMEIDFDWREESLHDYIDGNTELESLPAKDLRDLCENAVPAAVPGFEPIPLEKIGMDAAR